MKSGFMHDGLGTLEKQMQGVSTNITEQDARKLAHVLYVLAIDCRRLFPCGEDERNVACL